MKRLTNAQLKERDNFASILAARAQVVQDAIEAYNEAAGEASEWIDGIRSDMQDYYEERSEKWQEGEAGSSYDAWMSAWDERPETIDMPDFDGEEKMNALEGEP